MICIKLPVLFQTPSYKQKELLDLEIDLKEDTIPRTMIFYSIDSLAPYVKNNVELEDYYELSSGGESYTIPLAMEEVNFRIGRVINFNKQ